MRSLLHIAFIPLIAILLSAGCKKPNVSNEDSIILFQYEYLDTSPVYTHYGFFIDRDGNIITYRNPEDWHLTGNDMVYTEEQLAENLKKSFYTGIRVNDEELTRYEKYIKYLAHSKVSAPRNTGSEDGIASFICYDFSANTGNYRGTIIKTEGEVSSENLNFYSKRIASWLKDIKNSISGEYKTRGLEIF